jgi:ubiquinone biosynthesis protein
MAEQVGWRGLVDRVKREAPYWGALLPQLPRLLHQALSRQAQPQPAAELAEILRLERRRNRILALVAAALVLIAALLLLAP